MDRSGPAAAKRESFIIAASGELFDDQGQRHGQHRPAPRVDFRADGHVCRVRIDMPELGKHSEPYVPPTYWVLVGADGRLAGIGERVHFRSESFTVTGRVHALEPE